MYSLMKVGRDKLKKTKILYQILADETEVKRDVSRQTPHNLSTHTNYPNRGHTLSKKQEKKNRIKREEIWYEIETVFQIVWRVKEFS